MIVTSAALVIMAIAMLAWGFVAEQLTAVYASVGISFVSAVLLAIGVYLRRHELFGDVARAGASTAPQGAAAVGTAGLGKTAVSVGAPRSAGSATEAGNRAPAPGRAASPAAPRSDEDADTYEVPSGLDVPADALVHVVPGRRRYHLGSCRQLKGRQSEELTYEEAHEEGFTACTACMPDTALAARAARTPQPRRATPEPAPVGPANSTWDGQSVKPGKGEDEDEPDSSETVSPANSTWDGQSVKPGAGEDESDSADTVSPANSTWDGQSVKPGAGEDEDEPDSADTISPQNSTWDGQSVEPGADEDETAEDEAAKDFSAESAVADTRPAEDESAASDAATDTETEDTDTETEDTKDGDASTEADAGGADEDTGDGDTEATDAEPVQVVQGTKRYHRPECALVNAVPDKEITSMAQARAVEEGYGPCLACEPDKAAAR